MEDVIKIIKSHDLLKQDLEFIQELDKSYSIYLKSFLGVDKSDLKIDFSIDFEIEKALIENNKDNLEDFIENYYKITKEKIDCNSKKYIQTKQKLINQMNKEISQIKQVSISMDNTLLQRNQLKFL